MGYIVPMKEQERLTENIRVRISKSMKDHLEVLAKKRGPGTKLSDLAREAIHSTYFGDDPEGSSGVGGHGPSPSGPYPIQEITALRAAEKPRKSRTA
jgi:hypothetical protein